MEKLENNFLYLVVLGGRAKKANIELHDVRWVVGSKIEDTYDTLRKDWFGSPKGLHIDSYKKIKYICLLYTSPSPRDRTTSRMPSSA